MSTLLTPTNSPEYWKEHGGNLKVRFARNKANYGFVELRLKGVSPRKLANFPKLTCNPLRKPVQKSLFEFDLGETLVVVRISPQLALRRGFAECSGPKDSRQAIARLQRFVRLNAKPTTVLEDRKKINLGH